MVAARVGRLMQKRGLRPATEECDERKVAKLYEQFAEEDRALAEQGMADFARRLAEHDKGE